MEIDGVTIPPQCSVEVTFRTHQQRFFLCPNDDVNEIILGCLGQAYHRYPELNLHIVNIMSNHGSFLATPTSPSVLSSFMRDFLSTLAKRINAYLGRSGTVWERRYRAIPTLDEAALDERFRYILTQGTKENLVWSARDWPGVVSTEALLGGPPLVGRWRNSSQEKELRRREDRKEERARKQGKKYEREAIPQIWLEYQIPLVPMPHWRELAPAQWRKRVGALLREDDALTQERHEQSGTVPIGVENLCAVDPFSRPKKSKRSPAPLCHASTTAGRKAFRNAYRRFVEAVREAAAKLAARVCELGLPKGATAPPLTDPQDKMPQRVLWKPAIIWTYVSEQQRSTPISLEVASP